MEIPSNYFALRLYDPLTLYTPQPHNMFAMGFPLLLQRPVPTSSIVAYLYDSQRSSPPFVRKRHQKRLTKGIQTWYSEAPVTH